MWQATLSTDNHGYLLTDISVLVVFCLYVDSLFGTIELEDQNMKRIVIPGVNFIINLRTTFAPIFYAKKLHSQSVTREMLRKALSYKNYLKIC